MSTKTAKYDGADVDVISEGKGWATILLNDGATRKVRVTALEGYAKPKRVAKPKADKPAKVAKVAKAAKPAKKAAAKKAAKPAKKAATKRAAKPADERLINADLTRYEVSDKIKTASGRKAVDTADAVAKKLRGCDLSEAYKLASEVTGEAQTALRRKYEHLNPGMQRMNLGNRIRGAKAAKAAAKN